ncbi:MAG TPA: acyl-ACP--UDP-N-acetylglucosamine O-acyltransferase [Candidatus Binataceae bacterium]|nr:acyl-ACP--UDP-N-acetylglucosamine O-acyltransferase [Candidatus Binataceae bacterium]
MPHSRDAAPKIHPSAVVGPEAVLAPGVEVGPFCMLEGRVCLGAGTRLISHVVIFGDTEMGADNVVHPFAVIGDEPQDLSYSGAPRQVRIGDRNIFREGATVHRGCEKGLVTTIGSDNFVMHNAHIGHDCRIGDHTIIAGGALLAGWVQVGDRALVSGNCVVHQFTRIGRLALTRGGSRMSRDIPPFCIVDGVHTLRAINVIGLRRAGFSAAAITALRRAFTVLFGARQNLALALERLAAAGPPTAEVRELLDFIRASKRGVAFGPRASRGAASEE